MGPQEAWEQFVRMADLPDEDIDLARAGFLIAAMEYPELDLDHQFGQLDSLAEGVAGRLDASRDPLFCVNTLSEYLFDELGFQGNLDDYYDPRNSFLNEVLQRRLGIPITLSLVCIEVGKRLDIPLLGVSMPGHFLLRHQGEENLYIDPFNKGILLSEEECAQRLQQVTQANVPWDPSYLAPVSNRDFVARILRNLKNIYLQRQDHDHAIMTIDRLIVLQPEATLERRDRGIVRYNLGRHEESLEDLTIYLDSDPEGGNVADVERLVRHLRDLLDD
ncbi:MAG: transglutaminase family protein [Chloroflexi bacterium]|nr:transglutaminase family protein [Chloroflexota bacterium]